MQLARVIGTVVATQKDPSLQGVKLHIVQLLNDHMQPAGLALVAGDATGQAGEGELVFVVYGREAALAQDVMFNPADWAIVGIVDEVDVQPYVQEKPLATR